MATNIWTEVEKERKERTVELPKRTHCSEIRYEPVTEEVINFERNE